MTDSENVERARSAAESAARQSYGKLVAFLAARTRDVAAAEDALSEAFAAALADWPRSGCPANPEGWLMTVARRKLIDAARKRGGGDAAGAAAGRGIGSGGGRRDPGSPARVDVRLRAPRHRRRRPRPAH